MNSLDCLLKTLRHSKRNINPAIYCTNHRSPAETEYKQTSQPLCDLWTYTKFFQWIKRVECCKFRVRTFDFG